MDERNFVDRTEDFARRLAFNVERKLRALSNPRAEDRVGEIGFRLVQRSDRETDRHGALPETSDLGKDEPHPMALLPPNRQLPTNLLIDRRLRVHEPLEIKGIRHAQLLERTAAHEVPWRRA
jgi:hypothetical protein